MKSRFLRIILRMFILFPTFCWGHQDTVIELKNSKLIGLPENYFPATYDETNQILTIGANEMVFTKFLTTFFPDYAEYRLDIKASWYHDPDLIPPYLIFNVRPKDKDFSYEILFNLDSLEILEISIVLRFGDLVTRTLPIKIRKEYQDELLKAVKPILK